MESLPYKTAYSKRFEQTDPAEVMRQAYEDDSSGTFEIEPKSTLVTGKNPLSAPEFPQESLPDIEKIKQAAIDLSNYYKIDVDIREYSDSVVVVFWLPFSLYEDRSRQLISYLISQAQSISFQADTNSPYRFILSLAYSG